MYGVLVAITAVWGVQFVLGKLMVASVPPFTVAFARSFIATVLYVALALTRPDGLRVRRADLGPFFLLGFVGNPVYHGSFFLGLHFAPASDGVLLLPTMNPVFTVLVAWLLGRETPTRQQLAGMAISALGVTLVFQAVAGADPVAGEPARLLGDCLFLVGSLSWGIYSAVGRHLFSSYGAARATTVSALVGLGPMAVLSWLAGDSSSILRLSAGDVAILLYMSVFAAFLGFMLFNRAVASIGAGPASRFTNLVPVWGLVVAALVLGERPSILELAGGMLIVVGVWVSTAQRFGWPFQRRAAQEKAPSGGPVET
jgi:drug/metabolite transporter (DMT)-like permease